ncbi:uncharacterized protein LOC103574399 [Microplitis demolitor]|uniref:uncharacterized protein LOC103574399 n=1 Tax=Microplitis demolitor TaxID=69319 RepID=UPI0006D50987|nr:uncharacterized protein LOC103574399 [Microplitis demolitor]
MKGYLTFSPSELSALENVGWLSNDDTQLTNADGYFDILILLNLLSGFAEDYQKILINVQLELVLTISNTEINAYIQNPAERAAAENDKERIQVLNYITSDPSIPISFRTWELYEYPHLPATPRHIWAVKTSTQLGKPGYVVLGFQSARKNTSQFDHCSIRNIKLFLNSQSYLYGDLNLMIDQNQYALLYSMCTNFQSSYYDKQSEPLLAKKKFLDNAPLYVIDCSEQNKAIKSGPVDTRLEFESAVPFPPNTTAYCLVIHDRII